MAKHMTRRAFVTTACTAVAATALGCSASNDSETTWSWTQDDDLPVLCMQVSGGAIVAMGTHEELLKTCDIYRETYESQVKGGSDDEQ